MKEKRTTDTKQLVPAAQKGDEQAFETLVHQHTDMLWHEACYFCRDFDEAQDLMQETLIRAHHHLHRLTHPFAVGAWLRTMMRRPAANRAARDGYHADLLQSVDGTEFFSVSRDPEQDYTSVESSRVYPTGAASADGRLPTGLCGVLYRGTATHGNRR